MRIPLRVCIIWMLVCLLSGHVGILPDMQVLAKDIPSDEEIWANWEHIVGQLPADEREEILRLSREVDMKKQIASSMITLNAHIFRCYHQDDLLLAFSETFLEFGSICLGAALALAGGKAAGALGAATGATELAGFAVGAFAAIAEKYSLPKLLESLNLGPVAMRKDKEYIWALYKETNVAKKKMIEEVITLRKELLEKVKDAWRRTLEQPAWEELGGLEGFESCDFSSFYWLEYGWRITTDPERGDCYAEAFEEYAYLEVTLEVTESLLEFAYRMDDQDAALVLYIDGDLAWFTEYRGTMDWYFAEVPVSEGVHTFLWEAVAGEAADFVDVWLDNIVFPFM